MTTLAGKASPASHSDGSGACFRPIAGFVREGEVVGVSRFRVLTPSSEFFRRLSPIKSANETGLLSGATFFRTQEPNIRRFPIGSPAFFGRGGMTFVAPVGGIIHGPIFPYFSKPVRGGVLAPTMIRRDDPMAGWINLSGVSGFLSVEGGGDPEKEGYAGKVCSAGVFVLVEVSVVRNWKTF